MRLTYRRDYFGYLLGTYFIRLWVELMAEKMEMGYKPQVGLILVDI